MALVDRVWRAITEAVQPPSDPNKPKLVQVVQFKEWIYPLYLDGETTRVLPAAGLSKSKFNGNSNGVPHLDLGIALAS